MGVMFFYSSTASKKFNLVGKLQEMTKFSFFMGNYVLVLTSWFGVDFTFFAGVSAVNVPTLIKKKYIAK